MPTGPASKRKPDATTPIAALTTVGLGFIAGFGQPGFAIAGAAVVTLILALKAELHGFLDKLDEDDVKALARYAVIAGAVLPFLPSGHYGPLGAWNPQKLWLVVVLVTGFSFLGYVANRIFGERHGTIATALIGGAYSSTAVTQSLAQRLGSEEKGGAEHAGIALATAVMYLRVLLLIGDPRDARASCRSRSSSLPAVLGRLGRGLLALPQGAEVRRAGAARQSDRAAAGVRVRAVRRLRRGRRQMGGRALRRAGHRGPAADRRIDRRRHRDHHAWRAPAGGDFAAARGDGDRRDDHRQHGGEDRHHAGLCAAARACPAVVAMGASVVALLVMIGLAALRL